MMATYGSIASPAEQAEESARKAVQCAPLLEAATAARKQLDDAGHRFDYCLHWAREWQGFLQESGYSRQLEQLIGKDNPTALQSLQATQRARRLSYFGWKLAAYAAMGGIYRNFAAYTDAQDALAHSGCNATQGLNSISALQWLLSPGAVNNIRANGYFTGSERFLSLRDDATGGTGVEALNQAYDSFRARADNDKYFSPGPVTLESDWQPNFVWDGKFEPFQEGGNSPFTFIEIPYDNPFIGSELRARHQFLLHGPSDGRQHWPLKAMEWAEKAYGDLNERQYVRRMQELESASDWDKAVTVPEVVLAQGYKRAAYLSAVQAMRSQIKAMKEFIVQLSEFIQVHIQHGTVDALPEFERYVAKYNLLAAVAMRFSISKTLRAWRMEMAHKHDERFAEVEPNMRGYWHQACTDQHKQLVAMQSAISKDSVDPAAQAASGWLNTELAKVRAGK